MHIYREGMTKRGPLLDDSNQNEIMLSVRSNGLHPAIGQMIKARDQGPAPAPRYITVPY